MASSKEFKDYIIEQLNNLNNISYKQMMGEYLLYCDGVLFGGIYDNRLLIKITNSNKKYLLQEVIPYQGAKPMFLIGNTDDKEYLCKIINDTIKDLKK